MNENAQFNIKNINSSIIIKGILFYLFVLNILFLNYVFGYLANLAVVLLLALSTGLIIKKIKKNILTN
jgi:hypothetical protein